jgi:peptidoglycan glycosyltransferase
MKAVVESGTGVAARIDGKTVYGKTGTAETGADKDNAWFLGFTDVADKQVVVAFTLEKYGQGAKVAPFVKEILEKAIDVYE